MSSHTMCVPEPGKDACHVGAMGVGEGLVCVAWHSPSGRAPERPTLGRVRTRQQCTEVVWPPP